MVREIFSNPQTVGLLFDIVGAFWLAKGFVLKTKKDMEEEVHGDETEILPGGLSENLRASAYRQRVEATIGFLFLGTGFILQITGVINTQLTFPSTGASVIFFSLFIVSMVVQRKLTTLTHIKKAFLKFDTPQQ